jgi:hypothetical protein
MDTQVRTEMQAPRRRPPRWGVAAVAFAAALVLIGGAVGIAMLISDDGSGPAAAAEATPKVTFDGATCTYEGPNLIQMGTVEFTLTNEAESAFGTAVFRLEEPAFGAELERVPVGSDLALAPDDPEPDGLRWFLRDAAPGESVAASRSMLSGMYVIDCVTYADGVADHAWRAAMIEIVSP